MVATIKSKRIKQRNRFYRMDPRCHWCGERTELPAYTKLNSPKAPHHATIDHLNSRLSPYRRVPTESPSELRHVLSCFKCNQDRARDEHIESGRSVPLKAMSTEKLLEVLAVLRGKPPKQKKHRPQIKAIECEIAWRQFGLGWDYLMD